MSGDDGVVGQVPAVLAALADETRWRILTEVGREDLSASALAARMPVSRQAIAKHLAVLTDAGLSTRSGPDVRCDTGRWARG